MINNGSKIAFFRDFKKGVTLEMVLLMCNMIAKVDYMAFVSIEREEPCISPSPKNIKALLDRLPVRGCGCFINKL
jgi:hypothetical protein